MNNKYLLVGLALVVGLGVGYVLPHASKLGSVISPSAALDQQVLINDFNSLTADLQAVRAPLAGMLQVTTVTTTTAQLSAFGTSTDMIASGAFTVTSTLGDTVVLGVGTPTTGILYFPQITAANTVKVNFLNTTNAAVTPATTTFTLTVLPAASFTAPAALQTTTST